MDFNSFLNNPDVPLLADTRAAAAWNRINQKPQSVVFKRKDGVSLDAQTVRVEYNSGAGEITSDTAKAPIRGLVIFGVIGHHTVTDTDIADGYRFVYGGAEYRVIDTMYTIGEVQATGEAVG